MTVALIAGEGMLPEVIADRLAADGNKPVVYAMREDCAAFAGTARDVTPLFRTELRATLGDMAARGVQKVIFAGLVPKTLMYRPEMLDQAARELVASLVQRDDHSLLAGIVAFVEKAGFEVVGYHELLNDLLATDGVIAGRKPTEGELADVSYGIDIARTVVPLSFGQSIIVSRRSVVAVEAMEGTDAAILRAGSLCKSGVIVKMIKQGQDVRYDIPTVGPQTLRLMARAGLSCLAIQTGWTLILDREGFLEAAREENLSVVGVDY